MNRKRIAQLCGTGFCASTPQKGTGLSVHSQAPLDAVARELNERSRETLNYHSPAR